MIRRFRMLGMASLATLAVSMAAASGAQAVEFHSSSEHTTIQGMQVSTNVLSVAEGFTATACDTVTFQGTFTGKTTSSLPLLFTRINCMSNWEEHSTVTKTVEGEWKTITTTTSPVVVECEGATTNTLTASGSFHTSCEGTLRETYKLGGTCTYTYRNQEVKGVSYKNLGGVKGIEVTFNATPFHIVTSGGFFNCLVANGTHVGYTYSGTAILSGENTNSEPVELWVE